MSKARSTSTVDGGGRRERLRQRDQRTADVFLFLVAFRILNALLVRTFFQPDEYFQSLEPAWRIAFGRDSGVWITWEWEHQLRSSLHPYLFAAVYRVVDAAASHLSPLRRADLLVAGPKVAQGFISAAGDYFTWRLGSKIYGGSRPESSWVLGLTVLSPWQWFCSTRTLSNCLETSLTIAALYLWPWQWSLSRRPLSDDVTRLRKCLVLASLACILRPTNTIIWFSLAVSLAYTTLRQGWGSHPWTKSLAPLFILVRECFICGSAVLTISVLADHTYYGTWTLPPFRFLYFNVVQSLAVFYGKNDWHYYLSQGYPLLLITALPFALIGMFQSLAMDPGAASSSSNSLSAAVRRQLAIACIAMPAVLSLVPHKEVRFIYPLLPCLHILAAAPVSQFFTPSISSASGSYTPRRLLLVFLVLVNVTIAIYASIIHASGVINILGYLREQQDTHYQYEPAKGLTAGFLMPCHSTPWRSHLVSPHIRAWALGCEPPVNLSPEEKAAYVDEADLFYNNPSDFLSQRMSSTGMLSKHFTSTSTTPKHEWPDYLIFFSPLEPTLKQSLRSSSYAECYRTFNTAWHDDSRRKGDVIAWCRDAKLQSAWRSRANHTAEPTTQSDKKAQSQQQRSFDRIIDVLARERDGSNSQPSLSSSWWRPWWSSSDSDRTPDIKQKKNIFSSFSAPFSFPSTKYSSWSLAQRQSSWKWPWQRKRKSPFSRMVDNIVSTYQRIMSRRQTSNAQRDLWS
ncbi:glycosylphosphatidylinositol anchor biosynthesis [Microsporum audouinii]